MAGLRKFGEFDIAGGGDWSAAIEFGFTATWIRLDITGTAPAVLVEVSLDNGGSTEYKLGPSGERPLSIEIYNGDVNSVRIKCANACTAQVIATAE